MRRRRPRSRRRRRRWTRHAERVAIQRATSRHVQDRRKPEFFANGNDYDLDGRLRDLDVPDTLNGEGVRDLGAYECQRRYCGAADTVFCSNFDLD